MTVAHENGINRISIADRAASASARHSIWHNELLRNFPFASHSGLTDDEAPLPEPYSLRLKRRKSQNPTCQSVR
jgi:hypothetical protein